MPFPKQTPRTFNRTNIESINSGQIGCYGLYRGNTWIYVGKGDIRQRLLDHFNGDNSCITRMRPSHWVDAVTTSEDELEKQLILELSPSCNKRVG